MLGVAGTRHFLNRERYRWIAPVSAFYADASHSVELSPWPVAFRPHIVTAVRPALCSRLALRPDYLAIRSTATRAATEWAVAESKGTRRCLIYPLDAHVHGTGKHEILKLWCEVSL